ncbi:unnamed protein product [Lampetra planeri]
MLAAATPHSSRQQATASQQQQQQRAGKLLNAGGFSDHSVAGNICRSSSSISNISSSISKQLRFARAEHRDDSWSGNTSR